MKRVIPLLAIALLFHVVPARAQLLWKISGNALSKPSYIVGSMHFAPTSFIDSIAGLRTVMEEVEQVYLEVLKSDSAMSTTRPSFNPLLPRDTVLTDFYTKEEQDRINHFMMRLNFADETEDNDFLKHNKRFKPSLLFDDLTKDIYLWNVSDVFGTQLTMTFDENFLNYAIEHNKPVGALDAPELHSAVLDETFGYNIDYSKQAKVLLHFMDNFSTINATVYEIFVKYLSQDITACNSVQGWKDRDKDYRRKKEHSVQGRNLTWAQSMPSIMQSRSTLFVVGYSHLGHPKEKRGLLHLLRQQGYTVEPYNVKYHN